MVPMIDSRTVRIDKEFKETKERERDTALHEKRLNPFESTFEIKYVVQHQRINKKTFYHLFFFTLECVIIVFPSSSILQSMAIPS
jgi:hypothetical protein